MASRAIKAKVYEPVSASPVKSFFVTMLTRDIPLADAVLDLLDNCVDGILRSKGKAVESYSGYRAAITFNKSTFMIDDNCGGIPWNLHDYAFRLGAPIDQPRQKLPMVGVYGIGMKRAIFKMGRHCLITTRNASDNYEVEITPKWIGTEEEWNLPVRAAKQSMKHAGTTIVVGELYEGIAKTFGEEGKAAFQSELARRVAEQYAFIINKGFEVSINDELVEPRPTKLVFTASIAKRRAQSTIAPFIYKTKADGVDVFLAVGLTRAIPTAEEVAEEDTGMQARYKTLAAGWTVVCNDRAVVYCDRTELTGWGEDDVPRYHTQFIAISGIVEFRSDRAEKLPTTTTKRGIDAASPLYLQVKNKMREGLKLFTTYTYWWKGREADARMMIDKGDALTFSEVKKRADDLPMSKVARVPGGKQFKPALPRPRAQESQLARISFERPLLEVRKVGEYIIGDADARPSKIGEECFKAILKEAKK
jgi:histidine kinase/DNA gyrase B/HSP90-like ATPase